MLESIGSQLVILSAAKDLLCWIFAFRGAAWRDIYLASRSGTPV